MNSLTLWTSCVLSIAMKQRLCIGDRIGPCLQALLLPEQMLLRNTFDVRKAVHHHTIQIIQPTKWNSFTRLLLDVYVWLNMFRMPLRPSSGAFNRIRSLWFYRWKESAGALLVVVWPVTGQTTTNNAPAVSFQR